MVSGRRNRKKRYKKTYKPQTKLSIQGNKRFDNLYKHRKFVDIIKEAKSRGSKIKKEELLYAINSCSILKDTESARFFLTIAIQKGINDVKIYERSINAFISCGETDFAFKIYSNLSEDFKRQPAILQVMIKYYSIIGDVEKAKKIYEILSKLPLTNDKKAYLDTIYFDYILQSESLTTIVNYFRKIVQQNRLNVFVLKSFLILIYNAGRYKEITEIVDVLPKSIKENPKIYSTYFSSLIKVDPKRALELLPNTIKDIRKKYGRIVALQFEIVYGYALLKLERYADSQKLFEKILSKLNPQEEGYTKCLSGLIFSGKKFSTKEKEDIKIYLNTVLKKSRNPHQIKDIHNALNLLES